MGKLAICLPAVRILSATTIKGAQPGKGEAGLVEALRSQEGGVGGGGEENVCLTRAKTMQI